MRILLLIIGILVAGSTFAHQGKRAYHTPTSVIVVKKIKPAKRKVWVPGHWIKTPKGRAWVAGHWRRV
ncbi:MAG: hypothetical protein ABJF04_04390 [Reichenbachiella sp.]|uniref:hypothetical protein n=1 Tax=Reichenbachiella sp. TaxID=2184521 RepID=UPI0032643CD7